MECRLRQELDPQGVLVLNITLEEEVRFIFHDTYLQYD